MAIERSETFAVVGESGSGKTTMGSAVLGIHPSSGGTVLFQGQDITHFDHKARRRLGASLQAVFQDPYTSLNPVRTVGRSLAEPMLAHTEVRGAQLRQRVAEVLEQVGLPSFAAGCYPGEFSGGQRQRIAIARALIVNPALIVCDEPVSSLDVSVQAQVLNLLGDLQALTRCSYLFISHNLSVVRHFSRRVLVLYRGLVMEAGLTAEVYDRPQHPYTQDLISAVAVPDPELQAIRRERRLAVGRPEGTKADDPSAACAFAGRCPYARDRCLTEQPQLRTVAGGSTVACHFAEEVGPRFEEMSTSWRGSRSPARLTKPGGTTDGINHC
jgi:peptide/nickel transport system ATP-binding protein